VVAQLEDIFDAYWNSGQVRALQSVARTAEAPEALRAAFDAEVAAYTRRALPPPPPTDEFGVPQLALELDAGLPHLLWADAAAYADAPDKLLAQAHGADASTQSAALRNLETLSAARREVIVFSPYFVPGEKGMKRMQDARARGITVRVLTNAMSATDEPLATLAYERYRKSMLKLGVELYELSATQVRSDPAMRAYLGDSRAQLHVKLGMVDREVLILGSTNLDQRSVTTNTELAVRIASPRMCQEILAFYRSSDPSQARGAYQVRLAPDGESLQWVALRGEEGPEVLTEEPEADRLLRLKLFLMSLFVSEELL
jgi:putative cardiolipin synthase